MGKDKAVGFAGIDMLIGCALEAGDGDPDKAVAFARSWVIIGGRDGISEEQFQQGIAAQIRAARRIQ